MSSNEASFASRYTSWLSYEPKWDFFSCGCACRLTYERTVAAALNATLIQMESAHNAREADWKDLANRWRQFEDELTEDNKR